MSDEQSQEVQSQLFKTELVWCNGHNRRMRFRWHL